MSGRLDDLMARMAAVQAEVEAELEERRAALNFRLERGKAVFDAEVLAQHRALRIGLFRFIRTSRLLVAMTAPLIYGLIVPLVLLDVFITIYHAVCFPIYGIAKVKRSDHLVFDRQHLDYLNLLEKLNCAYCSYGNGLISYVREIAARTEQYWCPIKHAGKVKGLHDRYRNFVDYGDAEGWFARMEELRAEVARQEKGRDA